MTILVVGADNLGAIAEKLQIFGVTDILHMKGRNITYKRKLHIPKAVAFVLVLTDYINHNAAQIVKQQAKMSSVPLVFAKRSWCSVENKLVSIGLRAS